VRALAQDDLDQCRGLGADLTGIDIGKDLAIFSIHLERRQVRVDSVTEISGSCGTLDVPRYICPLMRPPSMKKLSPSLPDGPTFLRRSACVFRRPCGGRRRHGASSRKSSRRFVPRAP
jgi:hypothetical protein